MVLFQSKVQLPAAAPQLVEITAGEATFLPCEPWCQGENPDSVGFEDGWCPTRMPWLTYLTYLEVHSVVNQGSELIRAPGFDLSPDGGQDHALCAHLRLVARVSSASSTSDSSKFAIGSRWRGASNGAVKPDYVCCILLYSFVFRALFPRFQSKWHGNPNKWVSCFPDSHLRYQKPCHQCAHNSLLFQCRATNLD